MLVWSKTKDVFFVLLKRLFDASVNSSTWLILNSWYTDCHTSVCLGQHGCPLFSLECGVHQGSILLPLLFLLVMDPFLRELQSLSIGISVNGMYAGGFLHESICYHAFSAMVDDVEALGLVKERRELEEKSDFTLQILGASDPTTGLCLFKAAEDHIKRRIELYS